MELKLLSFFSSIFSKKISLFLKLCLSPTLILVIVSEEKILLNKILSIKRLKPKWDIDCGRLLNFIFNNSLIVIKNK